MWFYNCLVIKDKNPKHTISPIFFSVMEIQFSRTNILTSISEAADEYTLFIRSSDFMFVRSGFTFFIESIISATILQPYFAGRFHTKKKLKKL